MGYLVVAGFLEKVRGRKGDMQRKISLHFCQIISLLEEVEINYGGLI